MVLGQGGGSEVLLRKIQSVIIPEWPLKATEYSIVLPSVACVAGKMFINLLKAYASSALVRNPNDNSEHTIRS